MKVYKHKSGLFFFFFLLVQLAGIAQEKEYFLLKGSLKSASDGGPVSYASILISNQTVGVASNEKGQFEFSISNKYWNENLIIRALGYKTYSTPIRKLMNKAEHTITLQDTLFELTDVVVVVPSARSLMVSAVEKAKESFGSTPFEMDCFWRSTVREDDKYVKLLESVFKAHDRGITYDNLPKAVDISYEAIRRSNMYANEKTNVRDNFFRPQPLMTVENHARYLLNHTTIQSLRDTAVYDIKEEPSMLYDNDPVYILTATATESAKWFLFNQKLYVRAKDSAIIRIDFVCNEDKLQYMNPHAIPNELTLKPEKYMCTYVFKEHNNRHYWQYVNHHLFYSWNEAKTGKKILKGEEHSEIMVQNISFPKKGKSTLHNPIPRKGGWLPWFRYDPAFWQDYAPAKQIPYMPGMVEDLEKEMSLEDQFKKNGGITEEKPSGATGE